MGRILDRIEKIAKNEGIGITSLEKVIGASRGVLSRAISNGTDIQAKWIQSIVENYPAYSEAWLLTGKGEMLKPEDDPPTISHHDDDFITIPVVDIYAAAGGGYLNIDYPEQTGEIKLPAGMLSSRRGNYYCGQVKGDSMYPTLSNRDHIIFRVLPLGDWERIIDNKVYLVIDRFGAAYVKRIKNRLQKENRIVCISDNKDSNPSEFDMMGEDIVNIYQVECRISNNMSNLGDYSYQLSALRDDVEMLKAKLKASDK